MALIKIKSESMDLADTYAFTGTVTGAGKLVASSRILYTAGSITINSSSSIDTGIDHYYTASSTSNNLLHIIHGSWRKNTEGGQTGALTIRADDSTITEIQHQEALGEWHQDGATTDIKAGTISYSATSVASTNQIKYSLYGKGDNFIIGNANDGRPVQWTILEFKS